MHAGAGADVHHVVAGADHVLVVLHHQHRVADVAQMLERADQAVVIALVQADGWLIEHIHHAGQPGTDLGGQPDALGLAAGERVGAALQGQVIQPYVVQEVQPGGDFLDDLVGDLALGAVQVQGQEPRQRVAQRPAVDLVDGPRLVVLAHLHVARLGAQPGALAGRAGLVVLVLGQFLAHRRRIGLAVAALQVRDDPLEHVGAHRGAAFLVDIRERNLYLARAVQHHLLDVGGQVFERGVGVEVVERRQALQHLEVELVAAVPALDGARGQG
ncbi:hypothetical protein D3C87_1108900 [compost metagenome]